MPDTLCRLAVHAAGPDRTFTVELVVPATHPLGELLPSIVDAVIGAAAPPHRWYLTRVAGAALDAALSLRENDVRDGDVLVLAPSPIVRPRAMPTEPSGVVAATADARPPTSGHGRVLAAGLVATVVSAAVLAWGGPWPAWGWPLWSAVTLSVAAATASVAIGRADRRLAALLCTAAVVYGAATGVLAVPGASWQAAFLLASAAAFAISVVLLRVTPDDVVLTACAASTGAMAASAAVCNAVAARPAPAGAVLAVFSLGALSLAPAATAVVAGLGAARSTVDERRAAAAHRTLTGLVAGWSASAALGAGIVAAAAFHTESSSVCAAVFTADLGILLVLRQRSHIDRNRRITLGCAGFAALLAAVLVTATSAPAHGFWICVATATACGAALRWAEEPNPLVRSAIQVIEYMALAAAIPLAFWVMGLYGLVRELSLS